MRRLSIAILALGLAFLPACTTQTQRPAEDIPLEGNTLTVQGFGVRGLLLEVDYDPGALQYLGAEGPLVRETHFTPGKLRLVGVGYEKLSGEVLRLRFRVLKPGSRPRWEVQEHMAEELRVSWGKASNPTPQGQLFPLSLSPIPGITQQEASPDLAANPLGDLNGNGSVSLTDAVLLTDLLMGVAPPTPYRRYHGDLDSNGYADEKDLVRLLRKIVNPNLGAGLEVAPLSLSLNPGESAYLLVGNSGNEALPPVNFQPAPGLTLAEVTPSGYAGRVFQVSATQSVSQGAVLFTAGSAGSRAVAVNSTEPDFLLVLEGSPTAPVGGQAQVYLTLTPLNGFSGPVSLSLESPPPGIALSPSSLLLSGSAVAAPITLTLAPSLPPEDYALTLRAQGGNRIWEAPFILKATDFTLSGDNTLTTVWGSTGSLGVTVVPQNGFNTPLDLALRRQDGTPPPPGVSLGAQSLPPEGGSVRLQVANPAPGDYPLRLEATPRGGGATRTLDFTLSVGYAPEWRVELSWTAAADLDLHLLYPGTPATQHVYWYNPGVCPPAGEACLEGDTPQGPGQETLRFTHAEGSYRVYVHWYFGGGSWNTSGAQVRVYNAGYPVQAFPAPNASSGYNTWWHVLTVDGTGVQPGAGVGATAPQSLSLSPLGLQKKGR